MTTEKTFMTQKEISLITGLNESFISRLKTDNKALLIDIANRLQSSEISCEQYQEENKVLQLELTHVKSQCKTEKLYRERDAIELKSLKDENGKLKISKDELQSKYDKMQSDFVELKSFKDKHEGKNFITRFLGDGLLMTAIALALSTFTLFALIHLFEGGFLTAQESVLASIAVSICLLVFTVRKNKTGRAFCVGVSFIVAFLFSWKKFLLIKEWDWIDACVMVFFWFLIPFLEFMATKELK